MLIRSIGLVAYLMLSSYMALAAGNDTTKKDLLYCRRIYVDAAANDMLTLRDKVYGGLNLPKDTAEELARWLEKISDQKFNVSDAPKDNRGGGIFLLRPDSPLVPATDKDRLKGKGLEAFLIRGNASQLFIIANDLRGLAFGAYSYLEKLGVRWLLAGANWTVVPHRPDITLAVDRLMAPDCFTREYVPSGGFYSVSFGRGYTGSAASRPTGTAEYETEWLAWSRHMRNGGTGLGKATGEAFIATHAKILEEHPDYLAKINGHYSPLYTPARNGGDYVLDPATNRYVKAAKAGTGTHELNLIAKLNAGNPDAVDLFANWILQDLRDRANSPQGYAIRTTSVEPSDGNGEGNNYDELKAQGVGDGSESDQEFYIANACARKVRAEFPDISVVMYAYGQRSDPPTFPLEPNFIVQPVFGFRYGKKTMKLGNDEWLTAWKAKADKMAIYDFWSIPDWTHEEPTYNYLEMAKTLRYFTGNNIKGIFAESTKGGGTMGIGQYLASHLLWDVKQDEKALLEDWYTQAFGPAKVPMKRMLERWAHNYRPISSELGMSYHDMAEAEGLATGNAAVLARLDDYARYLHYLRLRNELLNVAYDPAAGARAASALAEYLFDIDNSRMVDTTRMFDQLVFHRGYKGLLNEFHLHNARDANDPPDGPGWARVHPLSHAEVAALIADGQKTYPLPDFAMKTYTGKMTPVNPFVWKAPDGNPWGAAMAICVATMDLQMPAGLAAFSLRVSRTENSKVTITDGKGLLVFSHEVDSNTGDTVGKYTWDEMNIPLPPGHYTMTIGGNKNGILWFQSWKGLPLTLRTFQIHKQTPSPRLYFYVPRGLQKIAIYYPYTDRACAFQTPVYDPNNHPAKIEERDGGKLTIIPVPAGMDGKIWSLERLVQPYEDFHTLNIPQAFALSPETLMAPADAR